MAIFYQKDIYPTTRLAIWKIEETESFFLESVPLSRQVTHPHKRLQHLAGRFLLQYLYPDFPIRLIQIADTRKPYLKDEKYHFSISQCGDYAAVIASKTERVGIDIEVPIDKILRIKNKFVNEKELELLHPKTIYDYTKIWSAKEAVFKWYGKGNVDFRKQIHLRPSDFENAFNCFFQKSNQEIMVNTTERSDIVLSYIHTPM